MKLINKKKQVIFEISNKKFFIILFLMSILFFCISKIAINNNLTDEQKSGYIICDDGSKELINKSQDFYCNNKYMLKDNYLIKTININHNTMLN